MSRNKLSVILILVCAILLFFTEKGVINHFIYTVYSSLLGVFFFPILFILDIVKFKSIRVILFSFSSNFVFSSILAFSAIQLFVPESPMVQTTFSLLRLTNAVLIVVHLFITDDKDRAFVHSLFACVQ